MAGTKTAKAGTKRTAKRANSPAGGTKAAAKRGGARGGARAVNRWTEDKERIFFHELSMVCNVSAALRKAGLLRARPGPWERRRNEPDFREQWDRSLGESYVLLELEMHARQRFGADRPPPADETEKRLRDVPNGLGLSLLKLHQSRVRPQPVSTQRPMRGAKLKDQLEKRLAEISRRLGGAD